eukprot:2900915-Rhodomonas_salina.3
MQSSRCVGRWGTELGHADENFAVREAAMERLSRLTLRSSSPLPPYAPPYAADTPRARSPPDARYLPTAPIRAMSAIPLRSRYTRCPLSAYPADMRCPLSAYRTDTRDARSLPTPLRAITWVQEPESRDAPDAEAAGAASDLAGPRRGG